MTAHERPAPLGEDQSTTELVVSIAALLLLNDLESAGVGGKVGYARRYVESRQPRRPRLVVNDVTED